MDWDFTPLFKLVEDEPWNAIRQCRRYFSSSGFGHHEHIYHLCAAVVGFARKAKTDLTLQTRLYNDKVFASRKYQPKPKHILRHSFQWAMEAPIDSTPYDSACIYTAALQSLFSSGLPIDQIVATIKASRGLYAMEEKARRAQDERGASGSPDVRLILANGRKIEARTAAKSSRSGPRRSASDRIKFDPARQMLLDCSQELLERCLNLAQGQTSRAM
jgi:hypothetical protein